LHDTYASKGLSVLGVTVESKKDTEPWIKSKGVKYAYAYDKGGKLTGKLGVEGIPHAFLIDADGKIAWEGHPGELTDEILTSALAGALPKPLFDFPPSAAPVTKALAKHSYSAALSEAAKLSDADGGPELKKVIEGMVASRVTRMKSALKDGDFLSAQEIASGSKKDFEGLPEASEPDKVLSEIKSNKDAERVISAQKKIRAIQDQKITRKKDMEKAIADLDKISKDLKGTYAAKEADELRTDFMKRRNKS
jgi:peroxiredoxin